MPRRREPARSSRDEHIRTVHPAADRDGAADGGAAGRRHDRLQPVAGGRAADRRLSDDQRQRDATGCQPRDHGVLGGAAARAPVRDTAGGEPDHVVECARDHVDYVAVRPVAQYRRRRLRRAGGDQPGERRPAEKPAEPADLPQGQPGRPADPDSRIDLRCDDLARARSVCRPEFGTAHLDAVRDRAGRHLRAAEICPDDPGEPNRAGGARARHRRCRDGGHEQHRRIAARHLAGAAAGVSDRRQQPARAAERARPGDRRALQLVQQVKAMLPQLQAGIPPSIELSIVSDRSLSISASFSDVQRTLGFTIVLVILVIFIFLRSFWATVIPSLTVPLSLVGTFAVLYIGAYSLDNLSLMALTLAVGLVVDDAIVMLENIFRYLEQGDDRLTAALKGAGEIGFTIVSITVSLIAVFIPILFMGGIIGRLFREFGVTVSVALILSAVIAFTLTPTLAALVLTHPHAARRGRLYQWSERVWERVLHGYERTLRGALRLRLLLMMLNLALIAATFWMLMVIPKGFFPSEDTGMIFGFTQASPDTSFMGMADAQQRAAAVVMQDPDVLSFGSAIGGN